MSCFMNLRTACLGRSALAACQGLFVGLTTKARIHATTWFCLSNSHRHKILSNLRVSVRLKGWNEDLACPQHLGGQNVYIEGYKSGVFPTTRQGQCKSKGGEPAVVRPVVEVICHAILNGHSNIETTTMHSSHGMHCTKSINVSLSYSLDHDHQCVFPWRIASAPKAIYLAVMADPSLFSAHGELWLPDETGQIPLITASGAPAAANYAASDEHSARTPPPDLPSLLLDSRIVFLGMPVRSNMSSHGICFLFV